MSIEANIESRKRVEQLFNAMLDLARPDFLSLTRDERKRFLELSHERFADKLDLPCCDRNQRAREREQVAAAGTDADDAIGELQEIIEMCDAVPDRGRDFADSVADGARSMIATIERSRRVSADQERAISNWHDGVSAWIE